MKYIIASFLVFFVTYIYAAPMPPPQPYEKDIVQHAVSMPVSAINQDASAVYQDVSALKADCRTCSPRSSTTTAYMIACGKTAKIGTPTTNVAYNQRE